MSEAQAAIARARIRSFVLRHPGATRKEIYDALPECQGQLAPLLRLGFVRARGSNPPGYHAVRLGDACARLDAKWQAMRDKRLAEVLRERKIREFLEQIEREENFEEEDA